MSKLSSLITLINSLSKSERKKIAITLNIGKNQADYVFLYKLIDNMVSPNPQNVKDAFTKIKATETFNISVNYLFDNLLNILSQTRINQDSFYFLFCQLMNVKVLYEKSIYSECFQLLTKIQTEARYKENFIILLLAQKLELDYLLSLDFAGISEEELLAKQYKINDTLKKIRKINEHAFLFELLKHRILYKGNARTSKQKQELNDLVVSEMSIVSSTGFENFEIEKTHKLFQSNYLMNVGDYKSALNSFYELNNTFEKNKHLLSNPPIYYLNTIEGILESLRSTRNYTEMNYFIDQLRNIQSPSSSFRIQVQSVIFQYTLFPLIDNGMFNEANSTLNNFKDELFDKINLLIAARQLQVLLYSAIVYIGIKDYAKARKMTSRIFTAERSTFSTPLFRTVRLINLIILYELNESDFLDLEIRSIKREIQNKESTYQIESMLFKLINKPLDNIAKHERLILWKKTEPKLVEIYNNKFELQLLRIFDFGAWIESKIKNTNLSSVLKNDRFFMR